MPIKLQAGTWEVDEAVNKTEQYTEFHQMGNYHHQICHGIRYSNALKAPEEKYTKHYRNFISRSFRENDETYHISNAVEPPLQGQWTRWLSYIQQNFSCKSLLASPVNLISFCLSSTFDTLPSLIKLKRWRISSEASCFQCNKTICTIAHILGACNVALKQGHFPFRHNNVLSYIFGTLKKFTSFTKNKRYD